MLPEFQGIRGSKNNNGLEMFKTTKAKKMK